MFLGQTVLSLYHKLNSADMQHIDNTIEYEIKVPDSTKQWCLALWNNSNIFVCVGMCVVDSDLT